MKHVGLALLAAAVLAAPADAIPAFARKYNLTCMTCHDPIPRLNAFGERFAAQGFMLMDGDTTGMTSLGDPLLMMNTSFPIAFRFDAYARYVSGTGGQTDFQTPWTVKLLSGGQVARNISYYVYLMMAEDGTTGALEDAWVAFRQPLGVPADVTVGQFQVIDPLWKREARITLHDYAVLRQRIGSSPSNLTYDRGLMVAASPWESTGLFAQLVNGNGIGAAGFDGSFDNDASKAGVLIGTQGIGPFTLGLVGYYGRQEAVPTGQTAAVRNTTRMLGPMVKVEHGNLAAGAQFVYRDDSDADFDGAGSLTTTRGGFAEVSWWPQGRGSRLLFTGLYNRVESGDPLAHVETATVNSSWLAARNVRLAAEMTWDFLGDRADLALGVVTAF
jgi:hypothetical protein